MARRQTGLVDFMLLLLLAEVGEASGYTLDGLVEQRGYRAWAGIGSSSIYARLKRLEDGGLATSRAGTEKRGRGPIPRLFELTASGQSQARAHTVEGLSSTRENDARFNLALCGIALLEPDEVKRCLHARRTFLLNERARLEAIAEMSSQGSLSARLLFERIVHAIAAEVAWLETVELE